MAGILLNDEQAPVAVDGKEGLKDMKIIDAIYQAASSGNKIHLSKL